MEPTIEIGTVGVMLAMFVASVMMAGGFFLMPGAVRITAVGAGLMYVAYQIIEFIVGTFIVVAI